MSDGIPPRMRATVLGRADHRCERCGASGPLEVHHRQYRSRGGKHELDNLVVLCGWGNHTGCHGWAHSEPAASTLLGFSVASWHNPAVVPIRMRPPLFFPDGWGLLDKLGGFEPMNDIDALELRILLGIVPTAGERVV